MHTLKIRPGISFDSTKYFFDSTAPSVTFDNNSVTTFFSFLPYKSFSSDTITVRLKNELTREIVDISDVEVQSGLKGTYQAFLSISNLPLKSTYEIWLFSGSTEIYRGKLFIYLGDTQNYSVVANES